MTPLDDGSALVYRVMPNHPLDLRPGDRVLGYDGRPWTELYPELLDTEVPVSPLWWGSSPDTFRHSFVMSVTNNGHLFDQIDVLRYASGQVEHLPTSLVQGLVSPLCTEQLDVAGVPKPDLFTGRWVDFGLIEGTRIGYIYAHGWQGNAGTQFYNAVRTLTQDVETDGLIIDFRFNLGGNMFLSNQGLSLLFAQPQATIGFAIRSDPADHLKMRLAAAPPDAYVIPSVRTVNPVTVYDKPIAVLTGPGAASSGDQVALRMTYLANVRTFGKSTATAFNSPTFVSLAPEWFAGFAAADAYRIEAPQQFLTHDEFRVDQPVWLRTADVANGEDTVVRAAMRWILTGATQ